MKKWKENTLTTKWKNLSKEEKARIVRHPPECFSDAAKAEWDKVPRAVRYEVHRCLNNYQCGIEMWEARNAPTREARALAEEFGFASVGDMVAALKRYTEIEDLLRRDLIAGLDYLCANYIDIRKQDGSPLRFVDIAPYILAEQMPEIAEH